MILRIEHPNRTLHRLNQVKLSELKKKFNELCEWWIMPNKSSFEDLVVFVSTNDGKMQKLLTIWPLLRQQLKKQSSKNWCLVKFIK